MGISPRILGIEIPERPFPGAWIPTKTSTSSRIIHLLLRQPLWRQLVTRNRWHIKLTTSLLANELTSKRVDGIIDESKLLFWRQPNHVKVNHRWIQPKMLTELVVIKIISWIHLLSRQPFWRQLVTRNRWLSQASASLSGNEMTSKWLTWL